MLSAGWRWMRFVVVVNIAFAALVARHACLAFPTSAACHSTHRRAFSIGTLRGEVSKEESTWGEEHAADARIAARLVSDAIKLCQEYERRMQTVKTTPQDSSKQTALLQKIDGTPVTALDFAIQGYILSSLTQYEHQQQVGNRCFSFLGEEDAEDLRGTAVASMALDLIHVIDSDMTMGDFLDALDVHKRDGEHKNGHRSWILDPIDGTRGLLDGKQYCIGLALCVDGKPTIGVLGNPSVQDATSRIMIAIKDHGLRHYNPRSDEFQDLPRTIPSAWHTKDYDAQQWTDSTLVDLTKPIDYPPYLLSLGPKPNQNQKLPRPYGPLCPPKGICCGSLVKYFAVASGQASSFVQLSPSGWVKTWDHAPGILCVQESGGSVVLVDTTSENRRSSIEEAKPNTMALPLLDRKEFCVHDGIICFAKEANMIIRKQVIDSIK